NVLRRKCAGSGDHCAASWATAGACANFVQLAHDGRAARAMNRSIHSASAPQARVGGVDDRVHRDLGDVADEQAELLSVREIDLHLSMLQPAKAGDRYNQMFADSRWLFPWLNYL